MQKEKSIEELTDRINSLPPEEIEKVAEQIYNSIPLEKRSEMVKRMFKALPPEKRIDMYWLMLKQVGEMLPQDPQTRAALYRIRDQLVALEIREKLKIVPEKVEKPETKK